MRAGTAGELLKHSAMNKAKQLELIKQLEASADDCIVLAEQITNKATRLKSAAIAARVELGDSPGGSRKAPKYELSALEIARAKANITGSKGSRKITNA